MDASAAGSAPRAKSHSAARTTPTTAKALPIHLATARSAWERTSTSAPTPAKTAMENVMGTVARRHSTLPTKGNPSRTDSTSGRYTISPMTMPVTRERDDLRST